MSKLTCMEAILEVLLGKTTTGLHHPNGDDIILGCMAIATGETKETDLVSWIAAHDKNRSEAEICRDICAYLRESRYPAKPSAILAEAIAAGKAAL